MKHRPGLIGSIPMKLARRASSLYARLATRSRIAREKRSVFRVIDARSRRAETGLRRPAHRPDRVAGILGIIDSRSRADKALSAALRDGMSRIILYGAIADGAWYSRTIEPIIREHPEAIQYAGCLGDKRFIYDSVSDVYDFSRSKLSRTIRMECRLSGAVYHAE